LQKSPIKETISAKETYNFKEPTNCSHPTHTHEASGETARRNKDLFLSFKEKFYKSFLPVISIHIINRRKCKHICTKNYCSLTESKRSGCLCHEETELFLSLEKLLSSLLLTDYEQDEVQAIQTLFLSRRTEGRGYKVRVVLSLIKNGFSLSETEN